MTPVVRLSCLLGATGDTRSALNMHGSPKRASAPRGGRHPSYRRGPSPWPRTSITGIGTAPRTCIQGESPPPVVPSVAAIRLDVTRRRGRKRGGQCAAGQNPGRHSPPRRPPRRGVSRSTDSDDGPMGAGNQPWGAFLEGRTSWPLPPAEAGTSEGGQATLKKKEACHGEHPRFSVRVVSRRGAGDLNTGGDRSPRLDTAGPLLRPASSPAGDRAPAGRMGTPAASGPVRPVWTRVVHHRAPRGAPGLRHLPSRVCGRRSGDWRSPVRPRNESRAGFGPMISSRERAWAQLDRKPPARALPETGAGEIHKAKWVCRTHRKVHGSRASRSTGSPARPFTSPNALGSQGRVRPADRSRPRRRSLGRAEK